MKCSSFGIWCKGKHGCFGCRRRSFEYFYPDVSKHSLYRHYADKHVFGDIENGVVSIYKEQGNREIEAPEKSLKKRRARKKARRVVSIEELMKQADGVCGICHKKIDARTEASRDHIISLDRGGSSNRHNLQLAHKECNSQKGNT